MIRAMGDRMMGERTGLLTRFQRRINGGAGAGGAPAALAVAAVFAAIALLGVTRATDPDIHWHLAAGRLIRTTGAVPGADPFSYTAYGLPWVDIQWLFQVGASLLFDAGGPGALTLAAVALVTGLFMFLDRRGRRILAATAPAGAPATDPGAPAGAAAPVPNAGLAATASAAVILLAALAAQERFLTRPEVLSWWFLALVLAGLDAAAAPARAARRRLVLWVALPLIAALWVNVQSLFILGPAMTALALVVALARAGRPGHAAAGVPGTMPDRAAPLREATDLLASLALQAAAALVNPHGARAIRVPFEQFFDHIGGSTLLATTIAEFRPTLSGYLYTPSVVAFGALAAATAIGFAMNLRRARLLDLLVTAATFYLALRARRNIPIFAIAAAPILLRNAREALAGAAARRAARRAAAGAPARTPARAAVLAPAALAAVAITLAAAVVSNRFHLLVPTERWFGIGPIPYYFPDEAAAFVTGAAIPGQVFHPLAAGGFLVRAWQGDRRVFIDGRNDPYLHGVLETYLRAVADPEVFEETTRRYQITAVLWPHQRAIEGRALLQWLAGGHGWVLIHLDPGTAVYARREVLTPGTPAGAALPGNRPPAEMRAFLRRRLAEAPFAGPPIREIALAEFLAITGDPAGAESFLLPAIAALPRSAPLRYNLGLALERLGRPAEARAAFALAAELDPGLAAAQGALGSLALDDGDTDEAERRLERAWRGGDRSARVLADRARLLESRGRAREAALAWDEATRAVPGNAEVLLGAARFQVRRGKEAAACELYDRLLRRDPGDPTAALERAILLERAGKPAEALARLGAAADAAATRLTTGPPADAERAGRAAGDGGADRRLLEIAVRLARLTGETERAATWAAALAVAGPPAAGGAGDAGAADAAAPGVTPGR